MGDMSGVTLTLLLSTLILIAIVIMYYSNTKYEYTPMQLWKQYNWKKRHIPVGGFNNSEYVYSNPNVLHEKDYLNCLAQNCKNNVFDYDCLSNCKLGTFRFGVDDVQSKVCEQFATTPHEYSKCLAQVYNDYKYP